MVGSQYLSCGRDDNRHRVGSSRNKAATNFKDLRTMRTTRVIAAALLSMSLLPVAAFAGNTNGDATGQGVPSTPAKTEQVAKVEKTGTVVHHVKAKHDKAAKVEKTEVKAAAPAEAGK